MTKQIKNSFDSATLRKILKSLGYGLLSAVGAFLVALSQGVDTKPALLIASGVFGSFLVNLVAEFKSGK